MLHGINFASAYADHIVAMLDGAVMHAGPPATFMTADVLERVFHAAVEVCTDGTTYLLCASAE